MIGPSPRARNLFMSKTSFSSDAAYWNGLAHQAGPHHLEENIAAYKRWEHVRLIRKWGGPFKGKVVLKTDLYEEAFGKDHFLFWLLNRGALVVGMDISQKIVHLAQKRAQALSKASHFGMASDVRRMAFKDATFDLIISNSTLDNLPAETVPSAFIELHRILKPGGVLILTLDNAHNPSYRFGYALEKIFGTNGYYQDRCYSLKEVEEFSRQNGFHIQNTCAIVHIPTPFNKLALFLTRRWGKQLRHPLRRLIMWFSGAGTHKRTQFLTGWFLAFKMVKK